MKILVLGGGNSTERDVSLRSAAAVAEALRQAGFEVQEADPREGLNLLESLSPKTIVFPVLHGAGGEDGEIQDVLEKYHLPFLGTPSHESELCFSKWHSRKTLQKAGVLVPEGALVTATTYHNHSLAKAPHVLKIDRGGSSIGTLIVRSPKDAAIEDATEVFKLGDEAVLEELIIGTEITVPILDGKALPVIEICPPTDEEFDYENKYNGATKELCPPVSIDEKTQKSAQILAEKVHKILNARHLSRVDIMVSEEGKLYVLELNTIPGLTKQSLYPIAANVAGIPMPELMKKFVELVKRDYDIGE